MSKTDDMISRKAAIDAFLTELTKRERKNLLHTWSTVEVKYFVADMLEKMPSAQPVARDINVLSNDLISRQGAIDALKGLEFCHYMEFGEYIGEDTREVRLIRAEKAQDALQNLPSAQPEPHYDEWCTDCKEYDQERHCCPRFNRVIRETVEEYKAAQPSFSQSHENDHSADDSKMVAQPETCGDPRADVYYLAEKIGIHRLYALVVELRGEPEPCEDAVSREAAIDIFDDYNVSVENGDLEAYSRDRKRLCELPSAQPELCEGAVSRRRLLSDLKELIAAWEKYPVMAEQIKGVEAAIGYVESIPSAQEKRTEERTETHTCDCISRQAAIEINRSYHGQMPNEVNHRIWKEINELPSAQPEPISDVYMKAVWTWLLDYQIKAAELKGRYTPYEVLSWVANDWRKEHE